MSIIKCGRVKITYPKMPSLRAIGVIRFLHDLRRSEVEVTVYVHPDDLPAVLDAVGDTDDDG